MVETEETVQVRLACLFQLQQRVQANGADPADDAQQVWRCSHLEEEEEEEEEEESSMEQCSSSKQNSNSAQKEEDANGKVTGLVVGMKECWCKEAGLSDGVKHIYEHCKFKTRRQ